MESLIPPQSNKGGNGAGHLPAVSRDESGNNPALNQVLPPKSNEPQPFFLEPAPYEDEIDEGGKFLLREDDGQGELPSGQKEELPVGDEMERGPDVSGQEEFPFSSPPASLSSVKSTLPPVATFVSAPVDFGKNDDELSAEGLDNDSYMPEEAKHGSAHISKIPHATEAKPYEAVFHIETEHIKPNPQQPRRYFDEQAIKELAASIREFGILQPLVVTKHEYEVEGGTNVEYFLIAGERRLLAAKSLGLERVPAVIRQVDLPREQLELAIIENLQRENLNPVEMARAFARLQDEFRLTQREIATRMGKSREAVANTMRLLDLPPYIMQAVEAGRITESHGRLLLTVADPRAQEKLFYDLTNRSMSTRELRNRVDEIKNASKKPEGEEVDPEVIALQQKLTQELGTPVKITKQKEGGKITISFYSEEELQGLLAKLDRGDSRW